MCLVSASFLPSKCQFLVTKARNRSNTFLLRLSFHDLAIAQTFEAFVDAFALICYLVPIFRFTLFHAELWKPRVNSKEKLFTTLFFGTDNIISAKKMSCYIT